MFKNKKAFTLVETIIVIVVIWVLMMWTIIYLEWSDEKRKVIEAQWCATTMVWWINNYIFYALTSKNLKIESVEQPVSPNFYFIKLNWLNSDGWKCTAKADWKYEKFCDSLEFQYSIWDTPDDPKWRYKTYSISDTCNISPSTELRLARSGANLVWNNSPFIVMNKWFSPINLHDPNIFYIKNWNTNSLKWNIIMILCVDSSCSMKKEVSKREIDWRTQTVALANCAYYEDDNLKCKTREGCTCYSPTDPTECKYYNKYDPEECSIQ